MNTATAVGLGAVASAAASVTVLLLPLPPAHERSEPTRAVQPGSVSEQSLGPVYETLIKIRLHLDQYSYRPTVDWDELDLADVEVELDAHLPPRNADQWRPIEVDVVRDESPRSGVDNTIDL